MRALIQRVKTASVTIDGELKSKIDHGLLVLLGVGSEDTEELADKLWRKISGLRIFEDEEGKTNLSIRDVGGNIMVVSQFTLYANCKKGNRPSFVEAAPPDKGNELYEYFLRLVKVEFPDCGSGEFGADMLVSLENDGPFTIWLDTDTL